jgi:hypothetical protein
MGKLLPQSHAARGPFDRHNAFLIYPSIVAVLFRGYAQRKKNRAPRKFPSAESAARREESQSN